MNFAKKSMKLVTLLLVLSSLSCQVKTDKLEWLISKTEELLGWNKRIEANGVLHVNGTIRSSNSQIIIPNSNGVYFSKALTDTSNPAAVNVTTAVQMMLQFYYIAAGLRNPVLTVFEYTQCRNLSTAIDIHYHLNFQNLNISHFTCENFNINPDDTWSVTVLQQIADQLTPKMWDPTRMVVNFNLPFSWRQVFDHEIRYVRKMNSAIHAVPSLWSLLLVGLTTLTGCYFK